jgi:hypothetical protein
MSKTAVALFFLTIAVPTMSQTVSRTPVASKDSAIIATEDSLAIVEMFARRHPESPFLKRDIAIGGSLGTPGIVNFIAEGYYDRVGLRIEGGAMLVLLAFGAGWQADVSYVLLRGSDYLLECSAIYFKSIFTSFDAGETTWYNGIGVGMGVTSGPIFLQLGIGHTRSGDQYTAENPNKILINGLPMSGQVGLILPLH